MLNNYSQVKFKREIYFLVCLVDNRPDHSDNCVQKSKYNQDYITGAASLLWK